jgi:hypothetical protein
LDADSTGLADTDPRSGILRIREMIHKIDRKRNMVKRAGHSPKNVQEFHLRRDWLLLKLGNPSRRPKKIYSTVHRYGIAKKSDSGTALKNMNF